jgi:hypothetical protein
VAEDELGCHPSEHRDGSRYYAGALNPASHE